MKGNKLKELREEKGWTQEQLRILSGVSRDTISRLENNKIVNVESQTLKKLAKTFRLNIGDIFF